MDSSFCRTPSAWSLRKLNQHPQSHLVTPKFRFPSTLQPQLHKLILGHYVTKNVWINFFSGTVGDKAFYPALSWAKLYYHCAPVLRSEGLSLAWHGHIQEITAGCDFERKETSSSFLKRFEMRDFSTPPISWLLLRFLLVSHWIGYFGFQKTQMKEEPMKAVVCLEVLVTGSKQHPLHRLVKV